MDLIVGSVLYDGIFGLVGLIWEVNEIWLVVVLLVCFVWLLVFEEFFVNGFYLVMRFFEIGDLNFIEEVGMGLDLLF